LETEGGNLKRIEEAQGECKRKNVDSHESPEKPSVWEAAYGPSGNALSEAVNPASSGAAGRLPGPDFPFSMMRPLDSNIGGKGRFVKENG
jgi:hypothetical protein